MIETDRAMYEIGQAEWRERKLEFAKHKQEERERAAFEEAERKLMSASASVVTRTHLAPPDGAYPQGQDRGLTIAGLEWGSDVHRGKKTHPMTALGRCCGSSLRICPLP